MFFRNNDLFLLSLVINTGIGKLLLIEKLHESFKEYTNITYELNTFIEELLSKQVKIHSIPNRHSG